MGANEWRHATSLDQMGRGKASYYFDAGMAEGRHMLTESKERAYRSVLETVDLADHATLNNMHSYPGSIIMTNLEEDGLVTEIVYATNPFRNAKIISGAFTGELDVTLNKRDTDLGVTVFEQMPDGRLFHLAYWMGRASYAGHPEGRTLLTAGRVTRIPFTTAVVSRRMAPGSRLVTLLDVNKNPFAQVNYGTGKDVSDESIQDAAKPLTIRWHSNSFINVPFDDRQ